MFFDAYLTRCFVVVLLLSGLPLLASSAAGLFVGVLQTATQIQEQTISFLARLISVSVVLVVLYRWYWGEAVSFIQEYLLSIAYLGRMS